MFSIREVNINDDSMHPKRNFAKVETWYYDAIFDNNYSIVSLINVIHLGALSQILTGIFIYKDNKLVKSHRNKIPFKIFSGSDKTLDISICDKKVLRGYVNKDSKEWITEISIGDENCGFDLKFTKKTKAFMGKTLLGNWLVIPHFSVEGKIHFENNNISVRGTGYHDHNMYSIFAPFTTKGYHFGKISLDSMNLIWANVVKNRKNKQPIVVLNQKDSNVSIDPVDIYYTIEEEELNYNKNMPKKWKLYIDAEKLKLDVLIEAIDYHYLSVPTVNYWRYHVRNKGYLSYKSKTQKINSVEISEFLKFF